MERRENFFISFIPDQYLKLLQKNIYKMKVFYMKYWHQESKLEK